MENLKSKFKLNNDELFIIHGIASLNMDDSKLKEYFKNYKKDKYIHELTLSGDVINNLVIVCKLHSNQDGNVQKVFNKLYMIQEELINEDKKNKVIEKAVSQYEQDMALTSEKYKSKIINIK